MGYNIKAR